jgi:hypothetical protein
MKVGAVHRKPVVGDTDIWQLIREEQRSDELLRQRFYESGDVMI